MNYGQRGRKWIWRTLALACITYWCHMNYSPTERKPRTCNSPKISLSSCKWTATEFKGKTLSSLSNSRFVHMPSLHPLHKSISSFFDYKIANYFRQTEINVIWYSGKIFRNVFQMHGTVHISTRPLCKSILGLKDFNLSYFLFFLFYLFYFEQKLLRTSF